jgi:hypothetical protein
MHLVYHDSDRLKGCVDKGIKKDLTSVIIADTALHTSFQISHCTSPIINFEVIGWMRI